MRTVQRAYFRWEKGQEARHALVDEHGFVFVAGAGGWSHLLDHNILKVLPGTAEPFADWYDDNKWWRGYWKDPCWAWIYGDCARETVRLP